MDVGMLWHDDSTTRPFDEKVTTAAAYYKSKYGATPNLCFVHPSLMGCQEKIIGEVTVRHSRIMMPNHFWFGIEKAAEPLKAPPIRRPRRRK